MTNVLGMKFWERVLLDRSDFTLLTFNEWYVWYCPSSDHSDRYSPPYLVPSSTAHCNVPAPVTVPKSCPSCFPSSSPLQLSGCDYRRREGSVTLSICSCPISKKKKCSKLVELDSKRLKSLMNLFTVDKFTRK